MIRRRDCGYLYRTVWGLVLLAIGLATTAGVAHAAPPPFDQQKQVVATFVDAAGRTVLLRRGYYDGGGGFGWDKITAKHRIANANLVEKIVKNPNGGEQQGSARVYRGFAQRFRCDISGRCQEVERIPLKAVVEFGADPNLGGQKGIITAFCEIGRPDCPSWVNTVSNVAPA